MVSADLLLVSEGCRSVSDTNKVFAFLILLTLLFGILLSIRIEKCKKLEKELLLLKEEKSQPKGLNTL